MLRLHGWEHRYSVLEQRGGEGRSDTPHVYFIKCDTLILKRGLVLGYIFLFPYT